MYEFFVEEGWENWIVVYWFVVWMYLLVVWNFELWSVVGWNKGIYLDVCLWGYWLIVMWIFFVVVD